MRRGTFVLVIDEDEANIRLAKKAIPGVAACGYADAEERLLRGTFRKVLISADGSPYTNLLFAAVERAVRWVGVLSSQGAVSERVAGTHFVVNGTLVFFSNGGEYREFLVEKQGIPCDLCGGNGEVVFNTFKDSCPQCEHESMLANGKDWDKFLRSLVADEPVVISMPVSL